MPTLVDRLLQIYGRTGLRGAQRLVNTFRPAESIAPEAAGFETRFAHLNYRGSLTEHIDRAIYYFGGYALAELDFLKEAARRTGAQTFFDVGANVGQHSLWMSDKTPVIHAFEPSATVGASLQANLRANGIENVTLWPMGLGDEDSEAQLGMGFEHNAGSRSLLWGHERGHETVRVAHGGRHLEANGLPRIDLLKIDVEGFEKRVLAGLAERLRQDRPIILIELITPSKGGFDDLADFERALYPDHHLFTLEEGRKAELTPFRWEEEEFVCIPDEHLDKFRDLIR